MGEYMIIYRDKIATGSFDKTCKVGESPFPLIPMITPPPHPQLWSSESNKCFHTFRGHTAEIVSVTFNPQSTMVATGSMDTTAKLWCVEKGVELHTLAVSEPGPPSLVLSGVGHRDTLLKSSASTSTQ